MDIVVKGRNVEVPDHYRVHVAEKLAKVERYDHKLIRIDVELFHERNPRQADHCQRVEITCVSRGPVIRAEACTNDFYSALDAAIAKLDTRLRRAADRRRVHRGRHAPISVAAATAGLPVADLVTAPLSAPGDGARAGTAVAERVEEEHDDQQPWHIAREKVHPAEPMTIDDALFEMELVGHDFYLFQDKESGRPSVVYRRHAYDYGIISLATDQ
ncbi:MULTISPECIES: ribosome hibernation-promoting factor, HPF/YfiA family [Micromonospora]|uniref:Ribosome hibernation promoting factor n=1 Tax=Micromonospora profundi TaxID=1420889 RepID=A0AAJ6L3E0_9ACTN|nr:MULTISPECIES: ribosome-associated translation inhibitor RaiA [Micromonospora]KOX07482.1 30S ribosomal protein S30 [Micromonospora sp. NRRL B-16802]WLS46091.1 ribosome-associated translation inhibitor RaiA [Micromonospora profundi]